ncbi:DUF3747 domain-containing protein [Cyanobium sp. NS01]|uniref:DUF3747 domain-containing protein n=1 Tax=Cyanobium sp. NS01 TaxID=261284 RepID=UPI0016472EBD|nr:DUF3747 domain-containing protein [Cyanobium sp. NS01]QNI71860.1 uncharacterized conserved secreted protein (DUF3747) [Cyanobium sp. NS01]
MALRVAVTGTAITATGAAAILSSSWLMGRQASGARAAALFGSEPIAPGQAIAVAQPLAGNRWNLIVLEQLQAAPPCWREYPDGSVISYDNDVAEGVCGRYLSSSAYSLRVANDDLNNPWRLRVESENGRLRLLASHPQQTTLIPVASGKAPASGLASLKLEPGWTFQRRTYGEQTLRHLYMAHAEPLPVLLARARGGGQLAALPSLAPPPLLNQPGPVAESSPSSTRRGLARVERSSVLSSRSRLLRQSSSQRPRQSGVIALEVVPYGS